MSSGMAAAGCGIENAFERIELRPVHLGPTDDRVFSQVCSALTSDKVVPPVIAARTNINRFFWTDARFNCDGVGLVVTHKTIILAR